MSYSVFIRMLVICLYFALPCSLSYASSKSDTNKAPVTVDIWPGEGQPVFVASQTSVQLYEAPDADSGASKSIKTKKGHQIEAIEHRLFVGNPVPVKFRQTKDLKLLCFGSSNHLTLEKYYNGGRTKQLSDAAIKEARYLMYRAEGSHLILIENDICQIEEGLLAAPIPKSPIEWWIKARIANKHLGWLLVGKSITEAKRKL